MADSFTTTGMTDPPKQRRPRTPEPLEDQINTKLDEVKGLLVRSGLDDGTADALLFSARPNKTGGNLVGNFADLQRAGGQIASGGASSFGEGVVAPATVDEEGNVVLTEKR